MVEYYSSGRRTETAFNFGVYQAAYVGQIYMRAFNKHLEGNLNGWFWSVQTLREIVNPDLKDDESGSLDKQEDNILLIEQKYRITRKRLEYFELKRKYVLLVKNYQRDVMKYLKLAGYLPNKRDRAKLGF